MMGLKLIHVSNSGYWSLAALIHFTNILSGHFKGIEAIIWSAWMLMKQPHDDVIKWKHFALLALCAGNSSVTIEFPTQRPVMRSFDVFFDLGLNKWLSKQSRCRWFETPSRSLWCQCYAKEFGWMHYVDSQEQGPLLLTWIYLSQHG